MKISFLLAVFIFTLGCGERFQATKNSQNVKTYQLLKLPSGKQIKFNRKGKVDFPYGQNSFFAMEYKTEIAIDDWGALEKEIGEIWEVIQPEVDKAFLKEAVIRANFDGNDSYGFAYSKQDDGKWNLEKVDTSRY